MAFDQEYRTSNRLIKYPLTDSSTLPGQNTGDESIVFGCFIDALVQFKPTERVETPIISGIQIAGNTIYFTLSTEETPERTTILTCTATGEKFPVISNENSWCWFVFVLSSDGIREFAEAAQKTGDISSQKFYLNNKCVGQYINTVSSLQVYSGKENGQKPQSKLHEIWDRAPDITISSATKIQEGFNMSFDTSSRTLPILEEEDNSLTLSAIPGAGKGIITCQKEEQKSFKTPGLINESGHVRLFNDTCYDLVPIKYSSQQADIQLHLKCRACCTCEMYVGIVNSRLIPLKEKILANQKTLLDTLDTYETNVNKWNKRLKEVLPSDIIITATGAPLDAAATKLQKGASGGTMNRCGFSYIVRNDSFETVYITISNFDTNGTLHESQVSYIDKSYDPKILFFGEYPPTPGIELPAGRSLTFTGFVRLPELVLTDKASGFIISARIQVKHNDKIVVETTKDLII